MGKPYGQRMIAPGAGGDFGVKHGPVGDMIVHQAISMLIMRGVSNSIFALDPGCQVRLHDGRLSLKSFGKIICLCGGEAGTKKRQAGGFRRRRRRRRQAGRK